MKDLWLVEFTSWGQEHTLDFDSKEDAKAFIAQWKKTGATMRLRKYRE